METEKYFKCSHCDIHAVKLFTKGGKKYETGMTGYCKACISEYKATHKMTRAKVTHDYKGAEKLAPITEIYY